MNGKKKYIILGSIILIVGFIIIILSQPKKISTPVFVDQIEHSLSEEEVINMLQKKENAVTQIQLLEQAEGKDVEMIARWYVELSGYHLLLGELSESLNALLRAQEVQPDWESIYPRLFNIYSMRGDTTNALAAIDRAISIDPTESDYWTRRIQFEIDVLTITTERFEEWYQQALEASETKQDIATFAARYYESIGNNEQAINKLKTAIELNPQSRSLYQTEITRLSQ